MDLDFSEAQEMLRTMAKDFLTKECPKTLVRQLEEDEKGYSPELWRKMAELGWMGLVLPEKYGGTGGEFMVLIILMEELGRNICPGPFFSTAVVCASAILEGGTEEQKKELLTKIANGETIMAFALTEPSATYDASGIHTKAVAKGNDYIINGTKLFVPDAHISDYMIVAARTQEAKDPKEGITLFLVDAKTAGIKCTTLKTIALDKQCEVVFRDVKVPKANILGQVNKGWPVVKKTMEKAMAAQCAEMVGGCQAMLDMSVAYAKERVQYGRPIGGFQVIQHYLANMWINLNTARNLTYEAAWRAGEGLECAQQVAAAKGWCNEVYKFVTERGVQVHGAIGITRDHDAGLYYRRAKAAELLFGDTDFQQEVVACEMGL